MYLPKYLENSLGFEMQNGLEKTKTLENMGNADNSVYQHFLLLAVFGTLSETKYNFRITLIQLSTNVFQPKICHLVKNCRKERMKLLL